MKPTNILKAPFAPRHARFGKGFGQRFIITIDTEEEFDWDEPMGRTNHGVTAAARMGRFQSLCEERGVVPLWLVDYPIAKCPEAIAALAPAAQAGRAEIGLHLHPWVNPPFDEELSAHNSYAGNLDPALERAKFEGLSRTIEDNFGVRPLVYRAGRYGAGRATAALLRDNGFAIDSSVRPLFNYGADGGPDYRAHPLRPYWLGSDRTLLELPVTTLYRGAMRKFGRKLHPFAERVPRLHGMLARTGMVERVPLTPEGVTAAEAIRAIDTARRDRLPVLVFSFHSPSLAPGFTPYVKDDADLENFYAWWNEILAHLALREIRPTSIAEIAASLSLASHATAS